MSPTAFASPNVSSKPPSMDRATSYAPRWAGPFGLGFGWFWMQNDSGDGRYTHSDQHGLTIFGGLHF